MVICCTKQNQQLHVKDSTALAHASPPKSVLCQLRCTAGISVWPKLPEPGMPKTKRHACLPCDSPCDASSTKHRALFICCR